MLKNVLHTIKHGDRQAAVTDYRQEKLSRSLSIRN